METLSKKSKRPMIVPATSPISVTPWPTKAGLRGEVSQLPAASASGNSNFSETETGTRHFGPLIGGFAVLTIASRGAIQMNRQRNVCRQLVSTFRSSLIFIAIGFISLAHLSAQTITWPTPAAITYGTALSGTQLDATASVPGSFAYSPAAGTVLAAGTNTLSVTFTPNDLTDYKATTSTVALTVNKATPVITWATPAPIVFLTALSGTQLDASISVAPNTSISAPPNVQTPATVVLSAAPLSAGVLQSCTAYYNQTPTAGQSLTFAIFNANGGGSFTIANSFTVTASASSGLQTFTVPRITVTAGQVVGYWAASGTVPGYGGQTVGGYYLSNQTTLPSGPKTYSAYSGGYPVSCIITPNTVASSASVSVPPNTQGVTNIDLSTAPLSAGVLQSCTTYYQQSPAVGQSLTFLIFNMNGGGSFTIANSFTVAAAASTGLQTFASPPIAITAGQVVGYWTASGTEPGYGGQPVGGYYLNSQAALPSGPQTFTAYSGGYPVSCNVAAGQFTYSPAAGTVPLPGSDPLSVTFTPTNTTDYTTATAGVNLAVNTYQTIAVSLPSSFPQGEAVEVWTTTTCTSPCIGGQTYNMQTHVDGLYFGGATISSNEVHGVYELSQLAVGAHTIQVQIPGVATSPVVNFTVVPDTLPVPTGSITLSPAPVYGSSTAVAVALSCGLCGITPGSLYGTLSFDGAYWVTLEMGSNGKPTYNPTASPINWAPGAHVFSFSFYGSSTYSDVTITNNFTVAPATPIYSYSASYDAVGNVQNSSDSVMGNWTFNYDSLNRLRQGAVTSGPFTTQYPYICWAYDSFGNRTAENPRTTACPASETSVQSTVIYSSSSNNQATSASGIGAATGYSYSAAYSYDAVGDVNDDGSNHYLYDAEGRLCAVDNYKIGGAMTGYLYDTDGTRVSKGSIKTMSCDPTTNGFTTTSDYILGSSGEQFTEMAANQGVLSWKHTNIPAAGSLLGTYDSIGLHFYFDDPLGTRRAQTTYAGVAEQTCASLPYGNAETCTPTPTEHLFTGKERDTESGLDYFGARYYASNMGRFISPDWASHPQAVPYASLRNPQSLNLYSYVGNNPLSRADADGHFWRELWNAIVTGCDCWTKDRGTAELRAHSNYMGMEAKMGPPPGRPGSHYKVSVAIVFPIGPLGELSEGAGAASEGAAAADAGEAAEGAEPIEEPVDDNPAQMKRLTKGEIEKLKDNDIDPHDLKPNSKYDLFKNKDGDIFVKPKAGNGPGEPTGYNIKDLSK